MWQELGIEPTSDAKAIRGAYARRLKAIDPERDPGAFQRLRQAYEAALASATASRGGKSRPAAPPRAPIEKARVVSPDEAPPPSRPEDETQAAAASGALGRADAEARPALDALDRALKNHDAPQALALLDEAMAKGFLPLTPDPTFIERLADVVAEDRTLPPVIFERLIRSFGWNASSSATRPAAAARAVARLEAAAWHARIVADAQQRRFGPRHAERNIARMMLGQNRLLPLVAGPFWKRRLRAELAQFDRHQRWLEGRFNPEHIEWLRSRTRQRASGGKRWYLILVPVVVVANLLRACLEISHH